MPYKDKINTTAKRYIKAIGKGKSKGIKINDAKEW